MYNLIEYSTNVIEYSNNYSKTSGNLWKYYRDEPINLITASKSFILKSRLLNSTNNEGPLNVEIAVPLKYLINYQKTHEEPLINDEINLILTQSANCIIKSTVMDQAKTYAITNTKLCILIESFSTQGNTKLLQQLKSGFIKQLTGININ